MFKFALGDTAYYLYDNKICSANVTARYYFDDCLPGDNSSIMLPYILDFSIHSHKTQTPVVYRQDVTGVLFYRTCHGFFPEKNMFLSKEELVKSLLEDEGV